MTEFGVAGATIKSMRRHKRKPADHYTTPGDATQALVNWLRLPLDTVIWEPACGTGEMSRVLEANGYEVISTDLRDTGFGEAGVNFLETRRPCDAVFTNPPFGSEQEPFATAEQFIRHALEQAPLVAMLLKAQYWNAASRLELFDTTFPTMVLPLTWRPAFLQKERGNSPLMDVIWVVWDRRDEVTSPYVLAHEAAFRPLPRPKQFPDVSTPYLKPALRNLETALGDLLEVLGGGDVD